MSICPYETIFYLSEDSIALEYLNGCTTPFLIFFFFFIIFAKNNPNYPKVLPSENSFSTFRSSHFSSLLLGLCGFDLNRRCYKNIRVSLNNISKSRDPSGRCSAYLCPDFNAYSFQKLSQPPSEKCIKFFLSFGFTGIT